MELCGDFRDQSKNAQVFDALHSIVKAKIDNGLLCIVDTTNIRNRDRNAIRALVGDDCDIVYHVIDRPLSEKLRDGCWRLNVDCGGKNLIDFHHNIMQSNIKDVLNSDSDNRVTVRDLRK